MDWIICHKSALEFWRRARAMDALSGKKPKGLKPPAEPHDTKELLRKTLRNFSTPLHVLVGKGNARKLCRNIRCHVSSGEFPNGSFVRIGSGLVVSSPELCFLQVAGESSFVDTVALGYELCGSYRLDRENGTGQGFRNDLPLTSVAGLSSYAVRAAGLKGRTKALKALRFISDGSASPMETVLAILLTLPYRFGGYGLPGPRLNYRIDVPINTGKVKGKSTYYCDLYWPDEQVAVEYDSDEYHTGSDRIAKDAVRRNALTGAGVTVFTVSRRQIIGTPRFRELAQALSKLLGKRIRHPYTVVEFNRRHSKLLNQLLHGTKMEPEG